ncbi:tetratricopeptide repeat protein [Actinomadura latina]|uniref:Tetratricopeptide repeat protein n=1 Tax=Actinomadura latina TaxID=163603 RepID=A0A846YXL9_9ACTN|nr:tetratricopeptide repeat protein [Actinomadura latina]NKZ03472.1 tetratricopeptide repeat protein [Actinomadura latina]
MPGHGSSWAIAVAELAGPDAALTILDRLDLDHYRYYHSTRADLLRRTGRTTEARRAYERALALTRTTPERHYLEARLTELDSPG